MHKSSGYNSRKLLTTDVSYDVCSLTPRHPEYNCRKVIYDSCIRQIARFSGRHFRMKLS